MLWLKGPWWLTSWRVLQQLSGSAPKVSRAVEYRKPGTDWSWNAFQMAILTRVIECWGETKDAERFMSCGWDLTCTAGSSLWRCCCWGSSGTAGASCLQPGSSAQVCSLPTPLAVAFHCLAGREPPLTQRQNINVFFIWKGWKLCENKHTLASVATALLYWEKFEQKL